MIYDEHRSSKNDFERKITSHGFLVWFVCWFFICLFFPVWWVFDVCFEFAKEIHDTYKVHSGKA